MNDMPWTLPGDTDREDEVYERGNKILGVEGII